MIRLPGWARLIRWLGWLPALLLLAWAVSHVRFGPAGSRTASFDAGATQLLRVAASQDSLFLTGDGGIVVLDGTIAWRVVDAGAYAVQPEAVDAGLAALFRQAALRVVAGHVLNDLLPLRGTDGPGPGNVPAPIATAMNRQLAALRSSGADLGVEIAEVGATASLPQGATSSFDAVIDATSEARDGVTAALRDAVRIRSEAASARNGAVTASHAQAAEIVAAARAQTASILALAHGDARARPAMLDQAYRERIGQILAQAKTVNTVDAKGVSRLILPGAP